MSFFWKTDLKKWLDSNRWTITSFAKEIGVERQSVHNWIEKNSFPKNEQTILHILKISHYDLLDFNGDTKGLSKNIQTFLGPQKEAVFQVQGGNKLKGEISIPGAKNAALPMLCAALLTSEKCIFYDVPYITDIEDLLDIFRDIGVQVSRDYEKKIVEITAVNINIEKLKENKKIKKFRASLLIIGPILARFGNIQILSPGGCVLGARANDVHLNGFRTFGAKVEENNDFIKIEKKSRKIKTGQYLMPEASVTATENLALFCSGMEDPTELFFCATEPHVTATIRMLQAMGANIQGVGTHRLKIQGKNSEQLKGGEFKISPDGLLAGTYALATVLTQGDVTIKNVYHTELLSFYGLLKKTGAHFSFIKDELRVFGEQDFRAVKKLQTAIFPGFTTDLQSPFGVLLTQCQGESMIFETLFENRLSYLFELEKMGARIQILNAHQAKIFGATPLFGTQVQSWDLRAGAAMVLAGLIAKGKTTINNIKYIDRGYENFDKNLQNLGGAIERV